MFEADLIRVKLILATSGGTIIDNKNQADFRKFHSQLVAAGMQVMASKLSDSEGGTEKLLGAFNVTSGHAVSVELGSAIAARFHARSGAGFG